MKTHSEGKKILIIALTALLVVNTAVFALSNNSVPVIISLIISFFLYIFLLRFFRVPSRSFASDDNKIYAPADGEVVVVEKTTENEYLKEERVQVSIFMSVWDVHINWYPCSGSISYYKYHPGKYLVARHPKSSIENERSTIVLKKKDGVEILVRQIAGIVARKISSYCAVNDNVQQGEEMGFIKFGSRVDIFLPVDTEIQVKPGDKVKGKSSIIALL